VKASKIVKAVITSKVQHINFNNENFEGFIGVNTFIFTSSQVNTISTGIPRNNGKRKSFKTIIQKICGDIMPKNTLSPPAIKTPVPRAPAADANILY